MRFLCRFEGWRTLNFTSSPSILCNLVHASDVPRSPSLLFCIMQIDIRRALLLARARSSAPVQSRNRYFTLGWSWLARTFPLSSVQGGEGRRRRDGTSKSISHPKREIYSPAAPLFVASASLSPVEKIPSSLGRKSCKSDLSLRNTYIFSSPLQYLCCIVIVLVMCCNVPDSFTVLAKRESLS